MEISGTIDAASTAAIGLLLSDDLIFTSRITGVARDLGLSVKAARSADMLLSIARQQLPRCVIVDLANPGLILVDLMRQLGELGESDRDALLLRYFRRMTADEMAKTLGISSDAAQKRVSRAVDRLREFLAKRGIAVGSGGLVIIISANAVQAAPVALIAKIAVAVASTTMLGSGTGVTFFKIMSMTKLKVGIAGALVLTGLSTALYLQTREKAHLWTELESARTASNAQSLELAKLRGELQRLAAVQVQADELARLRVEHQELLRLRGEVGRFREQVRASSSATAVGQSSVDSSQNTNSIVAELYRLAEGGDTPAATDLDRGHSRRGRTR